MISTTCRFSASVVTRTMTFSIGLERKLGGKYDSGVETTGDCVQVSTDALGERSHNIPWLDESRWKNTFAHAPDSAHGTKSAQKSLSDVRLEACCHYGPRSRE